MEPAYLKPPVDHLVIELLSLVSPLGLVKVQAVWEQPLCLAMDLDSKKSMARISRAEMKGTVPPTLAAETSRMRPLEVAGRKVGARFVVSKLSQQVSEERVLLLMQTGEAARKLASKPSQLAVEEMVLLSSLGVAERARKLSSKPSQLAPGEDVFLPVMTEEPARSL